MLLENLRLNNAKITYNDLIYLKEHVPVDEQLDHLKEDMLQIEVAGEFIVDVMDVVVPTYTRTD